MEAKMQYNCLLAINKLHAWIDNKYDNSGNTNRQQKLSSYLRNKKIQWATYAGIDYDIYLDCVDITNFI